MPSSVCGHQNTEKHKVIFHPGDLVLTVGRCYSTSAVIGWKTWVESAHGFNLQLSYPAASQSQEHG